MRDWRWSCEEASACRVESRVCDERDDVGSAACILELVAERRGQARDERGAAVAGGGVHRVMVE